MAKRKCSQCGRMFAPSPRAPEQSYCSEAVCQRARKRLWQKNRMARDGDYRNNQRDAQRVWMQKHPDYWREYRKRHPQYAQRNRERQRERNRARRLGTSILPAIAKMDETEPKSADFSGRYRLIPLEGAPIAKMDAILVEIRAILSPCEPSLADCKERTLSTPEGQFL